MLTAKWVSCHFDFAPFSHHHRHLLCKAGPLWTVLWKGALRSIWCKRIKSRPLFLCLFFVRENLLSNRFPLLSKFVVEEFCFERERRLSADLYIWSLVMRSQPVPNWDGETITQPFVVRVYGVSKISFIISYDFSIDIRSDLSNSPGPSLVAPSNKSYPSFKISLGGSRDTLTLSHVVC